MDWAGPAVGVAGLAFAVFAFIKNWKPKRLQYEIRSDQEIVIHSRYTRWADDLAVRFGARDLKRPRVVAVRVTNTGKVEALGKDFDIPLAVLASKGDEIIAAAITRQQKEPEESQELEPARLGLAEVVAPEVVLNEGEWLEFQLLVEGNEAPVHVRGHAAGFRLAKYGPRREFKLPPALLWILAVVSLVGLAALRQYTFDVESIVVPNLVGKPSLQAVIQLHDANLGLGDLKRVRNSAPVDTVVSQSPRAGEKVQNDTDVNLELSSGP